MGSIKGDNKSKEKKDAEQEQGIVQGMEEKELNPDRTEPGEKSYKKLQK